MSTPVRLAAFAAGLVVAFGAAWGVGGAVQPILDEPTPVHDNVDDERRDEGADHGE